MNRRHLLNGYVTLAACVAIPAVAWLISELRVTTPGVSWIVVGLLTAGLLLGEALPVSVGRGSKASSITFSGGFAFALVLVGPVIVPVLARSVVETLSQVRNRGSVTKLTFNIAQDVITATLSHLAFWAVSGSPVLHGDFVSGNDLLAILVAGCVHVTANHLLVTTVIALASGQPLGRMLTQALARRFLVYGMDVAIAPVSIPVLQYSPWLFPVLVIPVMVLHFSSRLTGLREYESLHDSLTGLPNRAMLRQSFDDLRPGLESGETRVAVMLVDLDHFKAINDTFGHPVGDLLLIDVSERLRQAVREDDTVARLGGDEFAVITQVSGRRAALEIENTAERLAAILHEPFVTGGTKIDVSGSVGIAMAPAHGTDLTTLMKAADVALYVAKEQRGRAAMYDPARDEQDSEQLVLLAELQEALDAGALTLLFTPQISCSTEAVVGADVLVQWHHPVRGELTAEDFMPLAEASGLAVAVTRHVLARVLGHSRMWLDHDRQLKLSVPLTARDLADQTFPDFVRDQLASNNVPAALLTVAVSEALLQRGAGRARAVVGRLRELGVGVAVEGYGSGLSMLALAGFDIDEVTIGSDLVQTFSAAASHEVIVRSAVELAAALDVRVLARDVRDADTAARLAAMGCDAAQGPVHGAPLSVTDFESRWLTPEGLAGQPAVGSTVN